MSSIVVSGDTSGAVTLTAPAVAGTVTVTLPSTTGTMLTTASTTGISGSAISSGTVPEAYGGTGTSTGYYGFKNRIINGAMVIDQRNAGASVSNTTALIYTLDRWGCYGPSASKFTVQQSSTAPAGFINSLLVTSSAATAVGASDIYHLFQQVEGLNVSDLGWGTASAQTITLSFQVRSSLTGTFGGSLRNSAGNRSYPFTYTISAANTWETKSIAIAGDTTGTWLTTNGIGISLSIGLGVGATFSGTSGAWAAGNYLSATGATSVVGTNGATFFITGVQLEKGSTATSFDYRPYGTELALCQRYCQNIRAADGNGSYLRYGYGEYTATTNLSLNINLFATMRTTPALTTTTAALYGGFSAGTISAASALTIGADGSSPSIANVQMTTTGLTAGRAAVLLSNNNQTSFLLFTAEL